MIYALNNTAKIQIFLVIEKLPCRLFQKYIRHGVGGFGCCQGTSCVWFPCRSRNGVRLLVPSAVFLRIWSRGLCREVPGIGEVFGRWKYGLNSFKLRCIMFGKDAVAREVYERERVV